MHFEAFSKQFPTTLGPLGPLLLLGGRAWVPGGRFRQTRGSHLMGLGALGFFVVALDIFKKDSFKIRKLSMHFFNPEIIVSFDAFYKKSGNHRCILCCLLTFNLDARDE